VLDFILFLQLLSHQEQEMEDIPTIYSHNNDSKFEEFLPVIHICDSYGEERRVYGFPKYILAWFSSGFLLFCKRVRMQYCPVLQQSNKNIPCAYQNPVNKNCLAAYFEEWH